MIFIKKQEKIALQKKKKILEAQAKEKAEKQKEVEKRERGRKRAEEKEQAQKALLKVQEEEENKKKQALLEKRRQNLAEESKKKQEAAQLKLLEKEDTILQKKIVEYSIKKESEFAQNGNSLHSWNFSEMMHEIGYFNSSKMKEFYEAFSDISALEVISVEYLYDNISEGVHFIYMNDDGWVHSNPRSQSNLLFFVSSILLESYKNFYQSFDNPEYLGNMPAEVHDTFYIEANVDFSDCLSESILRYLTRIGMIYSISKAFEAEFGTENEADLEPEFLVEYFDKEIMAYLDGSLNRIFVNTVKTYTIANRARVKSLNWQTRGHDRDDVLEGLQKISREIAMFYVENYFPFFNS